MKKEPYLELLTHLGKPLYKEAAIFIEENQNLKTLFQEQAFTNFKHKRTKSYGDTHLHEFT